MQRLLWLLLVGSLVCAMPVWAQPRLQSEAQHDDAIAPVSPAVIIGCEAKDQDGAALPRAVGTEGDAVRCAATLSGVMYQMLVNEDGSLVLHQVEDAAHASGQLGVMSLGVRNDTHTTALSGTDGDYTPLAVDSTGKLGIRGTFAEDAGHTSGDLGHFALAVRNDAGTALAGTDLDYIPFTTDSTGALRTVTTRAEAAATIDTENEAMTADTTLEAATTNLRLLSWTAEESAATPASARVVLRHGVVSVGVCSGNVIAYIQLGPDQSVQMNYGPRGLAVASGVCADVTAGTVSVNIHTVIESSP